MGIKYEPLLDPHIIKICEWGPWECKPCSTLCIFAFYLLCTFCQLLNRLNCPGCDSYAFKTIVTKITDVSCHRILQRYGCVLKQHCYAYFQVAWRPFHIQSFRYQGCSLRKILNIMYTIFIFLLIIFSYGSSIMACQARPIKNEVCIFSRIFIFNCLVTPCKLC